MEKFDYIIDELKKETLFFPSSEKPKIIFIGGISGAGKCLLIDKSKLIHYNDLFYVIDVDLFRKYFYYFTKFEDTIRLSNRIEMDLLNYLINNKKNIILVGTLRAYSYINKIILEKLLPSDYEVYFHLLVTNQIESTISAYERYIYEKQNGEVYPRISRVDYLNKSYNGFHIAISQYSKNDYFKNNQLFIRGENKTLPREIYYKGDVNEAIKEEERRQLENINNQIVLERINRIYDYLNTSDEINEFNNVCEKVLKLNLKTRKDGLY